LVKKKAVSPGNSGNTAHNAPA